ncbi:MAG: hypothetical protein ACI4JW_01860 [Oscillospiraceae bacterium]
MKALKVFGRIFFTIFFIALIFCICIIMSYTLNQPDRVGDSRSIITGPWVELAKKDGDILYTFIFDQEGNFVVKKDKTQIADGYFKIDEKNHKIKLLMIPGHYTKEFEKYVKVKVLAEISYSELVCNLTDDKKIDEDDYPTCTFLLRANDGSGESDVFECQMTEATIDLYNSDKDLTKDK